MTEIGFDFLGELPVGIPLQTMVKIGGIDVTSKLINYEIETTWGEAITIGECNFIRSLNDLIVVSPGLTVEIWRGWTTSTDLKIFSGYIESFNPEAGKIKITIKDKLWDAVRKEVNKIYDSSIDPSAGKISEIFKDLIETYAELTTSVQDSGTVITINKFMCNHTDIFERCKKLANILDWQFYYRPDTDIVYFEPQGLTDNSTILQVGNNIVGCPVWTYDTTEMINDLTVTGAFQEIETTESGRIGTTTGYVTDGIDLSFTPISVKVYGDASNPPTTIKVGGLPDSTTTFDYYVDKENKKIIPKDGTTFTTGDYYEIRYSHAIPIPVHLYNQASIDLYKSSEKTVNFDDLRNVADAEIRGTNYLSKYSKPFIYSPLKVKNISSYSIKVGDYIRVVDTISRPNVDEFFVVTKYTYRFPNDYDEAMVGDKTWRLASWQSSIEEKLKRIAESNIENQDLLTEVVTIDNTVNQVFIEKPRYNKILYQNMGGDILLWGNPDYGIWNSFKWGNLVISAGFILGLGVLGTSILGSNASVETDYYISQYMNNYNEKFIDTDFKDTCTCTWTTAGSATFTNGQTAISKSVDYNNGIISNCTLIADNSTNLTFQLTADGTNWETTTSGEVHTFTNTGIDLRWKAIASGNATLSSLILSNYH